MQGDVVGVGYRPRTGAIFFTRNGKKLEEVVHGLKSQNFFPAIGANGPATVHVNLGQSGFVFIEANVKKWGLAPVTGSLAPPPPYGSEQGSILLETGTKDIYAPPPGRRHGHSFSGSTYSVLGAHSPANTQHGRSRSGNFRVLHPTSPGPVRSPTDISLAQLVPNDDGGETSSSAQHQQEAGQHDENPLHLHLLDATNPPPDYTSPTTSEAEGSGRRYSTDSDNTPLIQVLNRSRGNSAAMPINTINNAPVPSYSDAIEQGAGQLRRDSSESDRSVSDASSGVSSEEESGSISDDSTNTVTPLPQHAAPEA